MAKRKINVAMILAAGDDAHLQTKTPEVSQAKPVEGEQFEMVRIEQIENNPMQPRMHLNDEGLEELADSIRTHGLVQPVSLIKVAPDRYILKAGQRRWLAHQRLGYATIKAVVEDGIGTDNKRLFEIAVLENTQRENLDPLELALSLQQAMDKGIYRTLDELSQALNKSRSYISKALKVLALDKEIIDDLRVRRSTNDIEALYEIQKIEDPKEQRQVYRDFVAKKLDRKLLRAISKSGARQPKAAPYTLKSGIKGIKLAADTAKLTIAKREQLESELKAVLEKHLGPLDV